MLLKILAIVYATLAFHVFFIPAVAVCALLCPIARLLAGQSKAKRLHEYINGVLLVKWMQLLRIWKFTIRGKAPSDLNRAYIFVANHASVLDTPILCHIPISKKYLTKSTYFNIPIFGWTQRVVGDIGVDVRYTFSCDAFGARGWR
jgi:1-acyl-sn-glycerol-3-phosphate acyltransferase